MIKIEEKLVLGNLESGQILQVPKHVTKELKGYQVDAVRFLYGCYKKKFNGAILNQDVGMNFELQIAAFLNALSTNQLFDSPVLIVASDDNILSWHYHIHKYSGLQLFTLTEHNYESLLEKKELIVILAAEKEYKILQQSRDTEFLIVIADSLDFWVKKRGFNNLSGDFNIGLTSKNFFRERDQKLLWKMLNWANPDRFVKAAEFSKFDNEHLELLVDPYADVWLRTTWSCCDEGEKLSEDKQAEFADKIRDWAIECNILTPPVTENSIQKRKPATRTRASNRKTKKCTINEDQLTSEADTTNGNLSDISADSVELHSSWQKEYEELLLQTPKKISPKKSPKTEKSPTTNKSSFLKRLKSKSPRSNRKFLKRKNSFIHSPTDSIHINDNSSSDDEFFFGKNPRKSHEEIAEIIRQEFGNNKPGLSKTHKTVMGNVSKIFYGEDIIDETSDSQESVRETSYIHAIIETNKSESKNNEQVLEIVPENTIIDMQNHKCTLGKNKEQEKRFPLRKQNSNLWPESSNNFIVNLDKQKSLPHSKSESYLSNLHVDLEVIKEFSKEFNFEPQTKNASQEYDEFLQDEFIASTQDLPSEVPHSQPLNTLDQNQKHEEDNSMLINLITGRRGEESESPINSPEVKHSILHDDDSSDNDMLKSIVRNSSHIETTEHSNEEDTDILKKIFSMDFKSEGNSSPIKSSMLKEDVLKEIFSQSSDEDDVLNTILPNRKFSGTFSSLFASKIVDNVEHSELVRRGIMDKFLG